MSPLITVYGNYASVIERNYSVFIIDGTVHSEKKKVTSRHFHPENSRDSCDDTILLNEKILNAKFRNVELHKYITLSKFYMTNSSTVVYTIRTCSTLNSPTSTVHPLVEPKIIKMVSIFAFYNLATRCHGINKNVYFIILINNIWLRS